MLAPFLVAGAPPAALEGCASGPGQADVFVLLRTPAGRACVTLRLDPDRLVVEARGPGTLLPVRWFGDGDDALLTGLGPDVTGLLAAHLTPAALARPAAMLPEWASLIEALDGRIAVGVGPALGTATVLLGLADAPKARAALDALLRPGPLGPVVVAPTGPGAWRVELEKVKKIEGLPSVSAAILRLEGGTLRLTTAGEPTPGRPALLAPGRLAIDAAPVAIWANQTGGRPHDGRAVMDAIRPVLGSQADGLEPWLAAVAWAAGRVGTAAVSVHQTRDTVRLRVEVELL
ncbi:MAG: hypothetical protein R3F60_14375 [bacterium]